MGSAKEWKKASFLRHARTWQHWRKIMRRSESRQPKARARRKDMATSSELRGLFRQSSARQHALKFPLRFIAAQKVGANAKNSQRNGKWLEGAQSATFGTIT